MLFFDLDGTLVDSSGIWLQIDLDFTARRGLAHTQEYHDFVIHSTAPSLHSSQKTTTIFPKVQMKS